MKSENVTQKGLQWQNTIILFLHAIVDNRIKSSLNYFYGTSVMSYVISTFKNPISLSSDFGLLSG